MARIPQYLEDKETPTLQIVQQAVTRVTKKEATGQLGAFSESFAKRIDHEGKPKESTVRSSPELFTAKAEREKRVCPSGTVSPGIFPRGRKRVPQGDG